MAAYRALATILRSLTLVAILGSLGRAQEDTVLRIGHETDGVVASTISVAPGGSGTVQFFYEDPTSNLEGFQIVVSFGDAITLMNDFSVTGTIVETVGAEFVNSYVDNSPFDGDGVELLAGILLDAIPPFDAQTIPPTSVPLEFARVSFTISVSASGCTAVEYVNGLDANQGQPFDNLVFIGGSDVSALTLVGAEICIATHFLRSDCNGDGASNLADAVFLLQYIFSGGSNPTCFEACRINGDMQLDVADGIYLLSHLFGGGPPPGSPYPDCGPAGATIDCAAPGVCP